MEKFGWKGLWQHAGSTYLAAGLAAADATLSYLNVVALPAWAHALVGVAVVLLAAYRGKQQAQPTLVP